MKRDEILSVLNDLHKISGFRVSLHGTDFEEIAAAPSNKLPFCAAIQQNEAEYAKCLECDQEACKKVEKSGKTLIYKCRHGLVEAICPLYNFGTLTGYLMMGQAIDDTADIHALENTLMLFSKSAAEAKDTVAANTTVKSDILASYVKIMTVCAEYMTLTNVVTSTSPKLPELAKIYIHEHYAERITIQDICKALGCSKSTLLTVFKKEYNATINSYICDARITEAKRMLASSTISLSRIAEDTGFYDQSYFSKVFLQKEGVTPSEYRRSHKRKK